jgi:putative flippase GtrA
MATDIPTTAAAESRSDYAKGVIKAKGLKYSLVSVFNVAFGQTLLFGFIHFNITPWVANVLAVSISAVPAYYMSRAWIWGKRGKSEFKKEVVPFCIFVLLGLLLSTGTVYLTTKWFPVPADASALSPVKLLPNIANIAAFGILWVIRFFWMDKAFHLDHHHAHGPLDVLLDEDEPLDD